MTSTPQQTRAQQSGLWWVAKFVSTVNRNQKKTRPPMSLDAGGLPSAHVCRRSVRRRLPKAPGRGRTARAPRSLTDPGGRYSYTGPLPSAISHLPSAISHLPSPISPISHLPSLPSPISHLPSPIVVHPTDSSGHRPVKAVKAVCDRWRPLAQSFLPPSPLKTPIDSRSLGSWEPSESALRQNASSWAGS